METCVCVCGRDAQLADVEVEVFPETEGVVVGVDVLTPAVKELVETVHKL